MMTDQLSRENTDLPQDTGATAYPGDDARVRPLPLGHRLGELQLDSVVGIGGFGIVYRAFDRTLQRVVAIKEYMPSMLATRGGDYTVALRSERFLQAFDAGRAAFVNEARLLAQFDHPGLVKVLHFWEAHGTAYMVMPFYEGQTLKQRAESGERIGEAPLREMLAGVLGALDTLHRAQCFHRDISLDNVLIRPDGRPVLLDFGAARKLIGDLVDDRAVMLKPGYAPIEQYTDDPAFAQGPWTDIYALGAVVHALIAGELPPAAVVRSIQDTYQPLATRALPDSERYSERFLAAIDHALQLRISDRPESVAAFAEALGIPGFDRASYAKAVSSDTRQGEAAEVAPPISDVRLPEPLASREAAKSVGVAAADANAGEDGVPHPPGAAAAAAGIAPKHDAGMATAAAAAQGKAPEAPEANKAPEVKKGPEAPEAPEANEAPKAPEAFEVNEAIEAPTHTGESGKPGSSRAIASRYFRSRRPVLYAGSALAVLLVTGVAAMWVARHERPAVESTLAAKATTTTAATPTATTTPPPVAQAQPGVPPLSAAAAAQASGATMNAGAASAAAGAPTYARNDRSEGVAAASATSATAASLDPAETIVAVGPASSVLSASAVEQASSAPKPPDAVPVRFKIRPWGEIYIGGVKRGVSPPLKSLPLAPGVYQIEVRNGTLPPLRRTLKIEAGAKPVSVDYAFE